MAPSPALTPTSPDVYRAIAYVMKEIGRQGIEKGRKNQQQGYAFRGIDEVLNALNPILSDAALCILPRMVSRIQDERATKNGGVLFYVIVQGEFDFVSAKDGSKHTVVTFGEGMDSADKATNKAMSAALKYACFQAFMIPTEAMDDADATTPVPLPKQQLTPQVAPPAPKQITSKGPTPRDVPEELLTVFERMAKNPKDRSDFNMARESYRDRLEIAGGAKDWMHLSAAFDSKPSKTAADARAFLLDLHTALGAAESRIGVTA